MSPATNSCARLVLLALQEEQLPDALLAVRARVDERRVGRSVAREDAEDVDAAGERIGDGLEDERGRAAVRRTSIAQRLLGRRRDALDEQVEQRRSCRGSCVADAAGDREELAARRRRP